MPVIEKIEKHGKIKQRAGDNMASYICSDIHGWKERYDRMMEVIQPQDTLYVLGDVIDRGEDGIAILMDIMKRNNVIMLLGNHEYMMKQYYDAKRGNVFNGIEASIYIERWERNHCAPTKKAFERLDEEQQEEILTFIDHLPVVISDLCVQDHTYYLVHGAPVTSIKEGTWDRTKLLNAGYQMEDFIWNRVMKEETFFQDRIVIVGHTPTMFYQNELPYQIWTGKAALHETLFMDIDCGCAAQNAFSRLALVSLDTQEVTYF